MGERTLLLVEDNQDDIDLTTWAFRKAGLAIKVDVAQDGVEALDYLTTRPLPAAMFLDLKLPRVSGLEVLERVRADARTKLLPVVVLTSSGYAPDVVSSYRLGCNSYVRKPVDSARFLEVIRQLGSYWLDVNEPADELP